MVEFRELDAADAPAFIALRLRSLRDHPEAYWLAAEEFAKRPPEKVTGELQASAEDLDEFYLGTFINGELVGCIQFGRYRIAKAHHLGSISITYIAPEYRRGGLGRTMLDETLTRARQMGGIERVQVSVTVGNFAALKLYLAAGFVPYGVEPAALKVDGQYFDIEWLQLRLC